MNWMLKRMAAVAAATVLGAALVSLCACTTNTTSDGKADYAPVRIGTMPNEHFLPMWVAEKDGIFPECGVDAELLSFDSAQALSAAIAAGQIDMAMVDVPRAVRLCESGTDVVMEWTTLGGEAAKGAFGVLAAADAPYDTLAEMQAYLATASFSSDDGVGVGVAANTIPEYVFDRLCEEEGVDPASIPTQEVASLPERYSLMASGNLSAAALPGSMLRLGEINGLKVLAEETAEHNYSISVMIATSSFAAQNPEAVGKVARAWDDACAAISADPSAYAMLLAEKANLNEAVADSYPIPDYPLAQGADARSDGLSHPSASFVEPQLSWMKKKGYSTKDVTYDESTGTFQVG